MDTKIRLFSTLSLSQDKIIKIIDGQFHYIKRVMRQEVGNNILLFNGSDGEWLAKIIAFGKTTCSMVLVQQTRSQHDTLDLSLIFSPIKKKRLDFMIEKATELGVSRLIPVFTERTDTRRINLDRLSKTAIEAAEQCGRISVPIIEDALPLEKMLNNWSADRMIYLMDETSHARTVRELAFEKYSMDEFLKGIAILVGPEGGFTFSEFELMKKFKFLYSVSLGSQILRSETAAVAALSCFQILSGSLYKSS